MTLEELGIKERVTLTAAEKIESPARDILVLQ